METQLTSPSIPGEAWRALLLALVGLITGTGAIIVVSFGVMLTPMSEALGINRTEISIALTIVLWSGAAIGPLLSKLMDSHGIRPVLIPTTLLFGLATLSLGVAGSSLWMLYGQYLLIGVCAPSVVGYAKYLALWFDQRRGIALSAVPVAIATAAAIFPRVAQSLIDTHNWQAAYFGLGAIVLLVALPATLLLREPKTPPGVPPRASQAADSPARAYRSGASLRQALRSVDFWIVTCGLGLVTLALQGVETHLAPIVAGWGISATAAVALYPAISAGTLLGQLSAGYLLDRLDSPRIVFLFAAVSLGGILLFQTGSSLPITLLACSLLAFGAFGEISMTPYLLTRYFGLNSFASIYAVNFAVATVFFGVSPVVSGLIFDRTGSYTVALELYTGVLVVSAVLLLFLRAYAYDKSGVNESSSGSAGSKDLLTAAVE